METVCGRSRGQDLGGGGTTAGKSPLGSGCRPHPSTRTARNVAASACAALARRETRSDGRACRRGRQLTRRTGAAARGNGDMVERTGRTITAGNRRSARASRSPRPNARGERAAGGGVWNDLLLLQRADEPAGDPSWRRAGRRDRDAQASGWGAAPEAAPERITTPSAAFLARSLLPDVARDAAPAALWWSSGRQPTLESEKAEAIGRGAAGKARSKRRNGVVRRPSGGRRRHRHAAARRRSVGGTSSGKRSRNVRERSRTMVRGVRESARTFRGVRVMRVEL